MVSLTWWGLCLKSLRGVPSNKVRLSITTAPSTKTGTLYKTKSSKSIKNSKVQNFYRITVKLLQEIKTILGQQEGESTNAQEKKYNFLGYLATKYFKTAGSQFLLEHLRV